MAGAGWAGEAEGKRGAGGLVQKLLEMVASLYLQKRAGIKLGFIHELL